MQRKAQQYGCITDYDESDQLLLISHKGVHLTAINPEGFMHYNSKDLTDPESREVFMHLVDNTETVREYVGLYESAPRMKPKDVQNYRKLSEYGDVVFAGMYSQKHGFMFCSWRQSDGGRYLAPGSTGPLSIDVPQEFKPKAGDYCIIKPRFSAFFQTELDLILRRLGVTTVILAGTTTPNCIRTTCYDGISMDYNVLIIGLIDGVAKMSLQANIFTPGFGSEKIQYSRGF